MDWLLKIVDGPMQGAEIALDAGRRVTFGRASACDIVVADAALAAQAFTLEVTAETVTLLTEGGESRAVKPFEVWTFGTTGFAVGPAEGTWEELRKPTPETPAEPVAEPTAPAPVETPTAPTAPTAADETPTATKRPWLAWVAGIIVVVIALAAGLAAWLYLSRPALVAPSAPAPTLEQVARSHGLVIERTNGLSRITGNVKRRTERLAIRALALKADPAVRFDLTDDESLAAAAEALLFTVAESSVKVKKVENRRVTIAGELASAEALGKVLKALAADVPGVVDVDASAVKIGAPLASVRRDANPEEETTEAGTSAVRTMAWRSAKTSASSLPVAGILTEPYRCVVLKDGTRWVEGAYVGSARLVSIKADRLTFEENGKTREWRP